MCCCCCCWCHCGDACALRLLLLLLLLPPLRPPLPPVAPPSGAKPDKVRWCAAARGDAGGRTGCGDNGPPESAKACATVSSDGLAHRRRCRSARKLVLGGTLSSPPPAPAVSPAPPLALALSNRHCRCLRRCSSAARSSGVIGGPSEA